MPLCESPSLVFGRAGWLVLGGKSHGLSAFNDKFENPLIATRSADKFGCLPPRQYADR